MCHQKKEGGHLINPDALSSTRKFVLQRAGTDPSQYTFFRYGHNFGE